MKNVIKYYCELCKQEIEVTINDLTKEMEEDEVKKATEFAKNYHWYEIHCICAVCGEYVKSEELEVANNKGIRIHDNYTDQYRKVKLGEPCFLIVHEKCIIEEIGL